MMTVKNISILLAIALLSYVALLFLPWWLCLIIAFFIVYLLPVKPAAGFLLGALAVGLAWLVPAVIADSGNDHILSTRMASLFHLPRYWMIIGITALAGAITGGLGGWTAALMRYRKPVISNSN